MKTLFTYIFVSLGVIFLVLLLIGAYFFITDPYNLKPLISGTLSVPTMDAGTPTTRESGNSVGGLEEGTTSESPSSASTGFALSEAQKQALISLGVDPASVPASISPEQEACFESALGAARVVEIKAGAVPNAFEMLKAKACL